jgi:hypothetical protein
MDQGYISIYSKARKIGKLLLLILKKGDKMELNALEDLIKLIRNKSKLPKDVIDWTETIAKTAYQLGRMDGIAEMDMIMERYKPTKQ